MFCSVFWAQNYTEQNTTVLEHVFCVLSSLVPAGPVKAGPERVSSDPEIVDADKIADQKA